MRVHHSHRAQARRDELAAVIDRVSDLVGEIELDVNRDMLRAHAHFLAVANKIISDLDIALALARDVDLDLGLDRSAFVSATLDFDRSRAITYIRILSSDLKRARAITRLRIPQFEFPLGESRRTVAREPMRLAGRLVSAAAKILPENDRTRYEEEFRSELADLVQAGVGRRAQLSYAIRQVAFAWPLRRELRLPQRHWVRP